jgi:hypothetical protein
MTRSISKRRWAVLAGPGLALTLALAAACGGGDKAGDEARSAGVSGGSESTTGFGDLKDDTNAYRAELARDPQNAAPSSDGAFAGQGAGGAPLASQLDRKLIRTATVQIEADGVSQRFEEVSNIALSSGGLVFSSSFGNDGERQIASVTIRVPGDRYEAVLSQLRKLGEVKSEQSNASDVTEEYTDLGSQLTNLQATEREYLKLLARAETIDEILVVQDRITGVRAQIEQVQGRINLLANQTDLATITVHLTPPIAQKPADDGGASSPAEVAQEAWEASLATLLGIAVVAIVIGAYGWWLLPLAAVLWYFGRRQWRADREHRQAPPAL